MGKTIENVMPMQIIEYACEFMGITLDDFATQSRRQDIVLTKVLVTYCLLYLGVSNTMIGKIILKKHCTITHYKVLINDDRLTQHKLWEFGNFLSERGIELVSLEDWLKEIRGRHLTGCVIRQYNKDNLTFN